MLLGGTGDDHGWFERQQLSGEIGITLDGAFGKPELERNVAIFHIAEFAQPRTKGLYVACRRRCRDWESTPIIGRRGACCYQTRRGYAVVTPPTSAMNFRRFI